MNLASGPDPTDLLGLPWSTPLEHWPPEYFESLPRGISRHVVRFVRVGGTVFAVKETQREIAEVEYDLLRRLSRKRVPAVQAVGVVAGRATPDGEPLAAALITKHLHFSLPYRALFSRRIDPDLERKLLDALAELLVKLHLAGFAWGDCSLSNTLFRRDAGALAAYLVDAETGKLEESLSRGQREYDLDLARTNLAGEMLDLQAAGLLGEQVDPVATADSVVARYERLWAELTQPLTFVAGQWDTVDQRIRRLNELGYDIGQIEVREQEDCPEVLVQTQVVEAGHHQRRLQELTGLSVGENQARRLLNDLDSFRAQAVMPGNDVDDAVLARHWMTDVFEPVVESVPRELKAKLEPAEVFHEVLEHKWHLSEAFGRPVTLDDAARSYVDNVLRFRPDEEAMLDSSLMGVGSLDDAVDAVDDTADGAPG
ncbi:DUF4032 domain-containing protein [Nocardioides sp. SYSU D00038]|uniref:DUF4032 domain-containing protein n=1 Tax=Nocardioides sp. SYSU D00038 TaxID=2812554 RepID=UPI001F080BBB|nr:DUF4032 domain-containing protein [Nocardioides sp. SYSU D00038]